MAADRLELDSDAPSVRSFRRAVADHTTTAAAVSSSDAAARAGRCAIARPAGLACRVHPTRVLAAFAEAHHDQARFSRRLCAVRCGSPRPPRGASARPALPGAPSTGRVHQHDQRSPTVLRALETRAPHERRRAGPHGEQARSPLSRPLSARAGASRRAARQAARARSHPRALPTSQVRTRAKVGGRHPGYLISRVARAARRPHEVRGLDLSSLCSSIALTNRDVDGEADRAFALHSSPLVINHTDASRSGPPASAPPSRRR